MTGDLVPEYGRFSEGWTTEDWEQLCLAIDTWNESSHDPDACAWCANIFIDFNLWDFENNEPFMGSARNLYMTRC